MARLSAVLESSVLCLIALPIHIVAETLFLECYDSTKAWRLEFEADHHMLAGTQREAKLYPAERREEGGLG